MLLLVQFDFTILLLKGATGNIYAVRSSSPGSHHDAHVFRDSNLFTKLHDENFRPFRNALLLGDSAYPTFFDFLATPFSDKTEVPSEKKYNKSFCRARVVVENTIGRLKNKFNVMKSIIRFRSLEQSSRLIQVLCAIFNFVLKKDGVSDMYDDLDSDDDDDKNETSDDENEIYPDSVARVPTRVRIMNKYFIQ